MRVACRLVFLAVLIYSTAVFGDSDTNKCSWGSLDLCNNLSDLDDLNLNDEETSPLDVKTNDFDNEILPSMDSNYGPPMPQCLLCKTAFRVVKKLLSQHASNDKVKNAMNRACNKLGKVSNKCHSFVNKHGDGVIRFVRNPRVICSMIGMCFPIGYETVEDELEYAVNADQVQTELYSEELQLADEEIKIEIDFPQLVNRGIPKCSICNTAMKILLKLVHHGGKDEIKRALGNVCHKLGKLHQHCEDMVNRHSDQIVDLVTKHTPPRLICKAIGMCRTNLDEDSVEIAEAQSEEQNNQLTIDVEFSASPKCFVCKQIMKAMKHMIQHHGDKGSIQRAMQKVCSKLGKLSGKCNRFIQRHGNSMVDLLTKHTPVDRVCKMMRVCLTSDSLENPEIEMISLEEKNFVEYESSESICELWELIVSENELSKDQHLQGPFCIICELLVAKLKTTVDSKAKRNDILQLFLHTCDIFPKFIRNPCQYFVEGYGSPFLDLLSKIRPHDVCFFLQTSANQTVLQEFNEALSDYLDTNCVFSTL